MDLLHIDFKRFYPDIINAYSKVYGEEYRDLISNQVRNTQLLYSYDLGGIEDYISYLKTCKAREYSDLFLKEMGIDCSFDTYSSLFPAPITELFDIFIDSEQDFSSGVDKLVSLLSPNKEVQEKIRSHFSQKKLTQEQISKYTSIYKSLLGEYQAYTSQFRPLEKYIKSEHDRKYKIQSKKREECFQEISSVLISPLNEYFELEDLTQESNFEYFDKRYLQAIASSKADSQTKSMYISRQIQYFKKLGIPVPETDFESKKDIYNYLLFLEREDIREVVPHQLIIEFIHDCRLRRLAEASAEYFMTRQDFQEIAQQTKDNPSKLGRAYNFCCVSDIHTDGRGTMVKEDPYNATIYFTIPKDFGGFVDYSLLHEFGTAIDQNHNGSGFESILDFIYKDNKNPYIDSYRIHERFNTAINDIFALEALDALHQNGSSLLEPKKFTKRDNSIHTSPLLRDFLQPLVQQFRKEVIDAKLHSNPQALTNVIGEENYEELVDAINHMDSIIEGCGNLQYIEDSKDYNDQKERINQIYTRIHNHLNAPRLKR